MKPYTAVEFEAQIQINEALSDLQTKQARWAEQEQKLSIGIMGQVKAGKSSFLNALLFKGKSILPEAATPKTANLTRITYSSKFSLTVEYYSVSEWEDILALSVLETDSVEAKVAKELVAMASHLTENEISHCLTAGKQLITSDSLEQLQGLLNQYTGNNGSHTPLVKSTELTLPDQELKGFEVVDTPGMNDPVASRTQKTREYMANCDVVFFLSRCSQFLDKADDDLLRSQLPNKGVKRLVVVSGQFDSAILDDGYDRGSLKATIDNLIMRQTRHARDKAKSIAETKKELNDEQRTMVVESLSHPVFSSTFAHGYAHFEDAEWSQAMRHMYEQLVELASDEWDYQFTQQDWLQIANFDALQQAFSYAKADRQILLDAQKKDYLPNAFSTILRLLDVLKESINQKISVIRSNEVADIENQQDLCVQKIKSVATTLSLTLAKARNDAKQQSSDLLEQLQRDRRHYNQLATRSGTREEERSYNVSSSTWYKPWTWGDTRTVYRTQTISYNYLSTHDAIEKVNQYGEDCAQQIVGVFSKLISPQNLKLELKRVLLDELDTGNENFDPMLFKSMLENFIAKLELPIFSLDLGDTTQNISNNFSGEITSASQMESLKSNLSKALGNVLEKLKNEFEQQFNKAMSKLEKAGEVLTKELTDDIHQQLEDIKEQIHKKEEEISRYHNLLNDVNEDMEYINRELSSLDS